MNLTRTTITAGLAALSLAVSAAPAVAKGGGEVNNTVITFNSALIAPVLGGGGGGNGGGSGRPATCRAVGVDPVTGSILKTCTQARA